MFKRTPTEKTFESGHWDGNYGFNVLNPAALLPLARHRVAVRRAKDGVDLPGSPTWLLRPEVGFDSSLRPLLESATSATISLGASPRMSINRLVLLCAC